VQDIHQILLKYWGYSHFRPLQEDIIKAVCRGEDTLGLMPTGGGKSLTFQVPALAMEGLCIVVTPLIALMRDQVQNLAGRGIKALCIYSGMTRAEIDIALDNCIYGDYKFLYCSPERIASEIFKVRIQKMNVSFIVVDEAHCISQWGYDFRPSYLRIAELREMLGQVPVLAVTATATPEVAEDIMVQLRFRKKNLLKMSFERKNLTYLVRNVEDKLSYLLRITEHVQGTGIIYVRNRARTREIADFLEKNGISSGFYHAGLTDEIRNLRESEWKHGKIRVIVATNAFGMGIDKPDVRFVIHYDLPESPEAYFQEAGRAGRDEKRSFAILLYHPSDRQNLEKRVRSNFPEIPAIRGVYNAIGNYFQVPVGSGKGTSFNFNLFDFCTHFKLNSAIVYSSLKILEREGYIELTDNLNIPSMVHFLVERDDLYKFQVANQQFDDFIRLLLRSYTGFFTEFVGINEELLAQRSKTNRDAIYQFLLKLQQQHILTYIPRRKDPVIVYTEERLDEKSLFISHENYHRRLERFEQRLNAMVNYAEEKSKCRSHYLLSYFGDLSSERCGKCDICTKKNELELSKYEFDLVLSKIKETLHTEALDLKTLVDRHASLFEEDKIIRVVQWLLDNGKIVYSPAGQLTWHETDPA
jgi:ATP-dependent DNA helicase RecQ